jgi:hypothetical protein
MRHAAAIMGFALVGWGLCAVTMGVGMAVVGLKVALVVHAAAAPVIFAAISLVCFKRLAYTTPLTTAAVFLAVVVIMDVGVVSMLVQRSFEMFTSFLGTWLPFMLIFASTYLVGAIARSRRRN